MAGVVVAPAAVALLALLGISQKMHLQQPILGGSVPADTCRLPAVGSDAVGASSTQAPMRPWDAPSLLLPLVAQKHFISLRDPDVILVGLGQRVDVETRQVAEFQAQSAKNKVNRAANPEAAAIIYSEMSSSVGAHKQKMETQLGRSVTQIEAYKRRRTTTRAVRGQRMLRMMEERQRQHNNNEKPLLSLQCSMASDEQQVSMSGADDRKRGRVFNLDSETHHSIARSSQASRSTVVSLSPPQPQCPDIDGWVLVLERYIRSINPNWSDYLAPEPLTNPSAPMMTTTTKNTRPLWII
ncbi:UNVERIFIED_CONTAM: hypothetical protein Sindi_2877900 [Sesamum indicum]